MEVQLHKQIKDVNMKPITTFLTFLTYILFGSCVNQQTEPLIKSFVDEMIISGEIDKIEKYLDLGENVKSKPEYLTFFQENFNSIKSKMEEECNLNYELFTFDDARESGIKTVQQYEKKYSKFEHVYFVVCNEKVIMPIISENNKIISFQSSILKKNGGDYSPFFLNDQPF